MQLFLDRTASGLAAQPYAGRSMLEGEVALKGSDQKNSSPGRNHLALSPSVLPSKVSMHSNKLSTYEN